VTFHANRGLVHLSSSHSVSENFARLERAVAAKRIQSSLGSITVATLPGSG
jgi:hypothetical protein